VYSSILLWIFFSLMKFVKSNHRATLKNEHLGEINWHSFNNALSRFLRSAKSNKNLILTILYIIYCKTCSLYHSGPNFFWSRTICGLCIFTTYSLESTLFQENSIYPTSFDQKFGKPDLTQMQQEQHGCENDNGHFSKLIREVHKNAGNY